MSYGFRITAFIAFGLLIVATNPVSGKELEDRRWFEVRTNNFRIFSALDEEGSLEVARNLEVFRATVAIVMNVRFNDSPIPTEIYVLPKNSELKRIGLNWLSSGWSLFKLRTNRSVMTDPRNNGKTVVYMHEYTHFLIRNHGTSKYPKWFDEGLAEYLKQGHTSAGGYVVGDASDYPIRRDTFLSDNILNAPWIPMHTVISPSDYDDWSDAHKRAYATESWALVHFLQHRLDRGTLLGSDMTSYVELVESGKTNIEAFEAIFDIPVEDLEGMLKRYLRKSRVPNHRLKINDVLDDFEPDVRSLSREQVSLALAKLALGFGELDKAERWFTIAVNDELSRPQAESGLGEVLKNKGNIKAAQVHFEQSVALAPSDPYGQLDAAEFWYSRAKSASDSGARVSYLAQAREHLVKAWKLDDSIPETYLVYSEVLLFEGQPHDLAIEALEKAEFLIPSSIGVHALLAKAYLQANRKEDAIEEARLVLDWGDAESDEAKQAREILDSVSTSP